MLRNYYFFRVLIILLSFYLTNSVYSQDNLIKDSINPYCQGNDIDEFFNALSSVIKIMGIENICY